MADPFGMFLALVQAAAAAGDPSIWDQMVGVGALLGGIAALVGLVYAGRQLSLLRKQIEITTREAKLDRALNFVCRWNDPEFDRVRAKTAQFLRHEPSPREIEEKRDEDPEFRANLSLTINFLEELGLAWNREEIHRETCFGFFGGIVVGYWDWLHSFVVEHRRGLAMKRQALNKKVSKKVWFEFETMHEEMDQMADDL